MGLFSGIFGKRDNKNNQTINTNELSKADQKNTITETAPSYHLRGIPDANGLYPSELVMLSVAEKYKTSETNYPKYLVYDYEIPNPMKMLKDLQTRGFIRVGSPIETLSVLKVSELKSVASQLNLNGKNKKDEIIAQLSKENENALSKAITERVWKLTDAGQAEIKANPYIKFFLDEHSYNVAEVGVTLWTVNDAFIKNPKFLYRDIIFQQINDQQNKAYLEFTTKRALGNMSTRRYCDCFRIMSLFIEEEGTSYINAADYYFQYIYNIINIQAGLELIICYKLKLATKDTKNLAGLINHFYDEIQLSPFQRIELLRLIDELGISREEVREKMILSFERTNNKGIMTANEAADFVLLELSGDVDQSKDLAEKLAKNALKKIR